MSEPGVFKALQDIFFFDIHSKRGLQKLYSLMFILLVIFYLHSFWIPIEISKWINTNLIYIGIILLYFVPALTEKLLFVRDALQYDVSDKNPYASFFQKQFPSKYISQKFNIDETQSSMYWFSIFNKWKASDHPHNAWRQTSFDKGYTCRVIYYIQLWSFRFFVLAVTHLIILIALRLFVISSTPIAVSSLFEIELIQWKIGYPLAMLLTHFLLKANNRIKGEVPTGVWYQWKEINDIMKRWLDENVNSINDLQQLAK